MAAFVVASCSVVESIWPGGDDATVEESPDVTDEDATTEGDTERDYTDLNRRRNERDRERDREEESDDPRPRDTVERRTRGDEPPKADLSVTGDEREKLADYYAVEAERRFLAAEEAAALRYLDQALQLDSDNAKALALREQINARLGVGGNIYESRIEEDQALRSEAVAEVSRRVNKAQEHLDNERYTEAIEEAESAIDMIRWSHHLMEDDRSLYAAQEIVKVAQERREFQRLRDYAQVKEEQRRHKRLQALSQLERYQDEIRKLYDDAKHLFERKEYGECILKLEQILRRDPFNEDVTQLKRIATSLEKGVRDREAYEQFHYNWKMLMTQIELTSAFPSGDLVLPTYEYWDHVEERHDRVRDQQSISLSKADIAVRQALESKQVDMNYTSESTLAEVIADLRQQAHVNIVATQGSDPAKAVNMTITVQTADQAGINLPSVRLRDALNLMTQQPGALFENLAWRVENGAVIFDLADNKTAVGGTSQIFNVADILVNLKVFRAEEPILARDQNANSQFPDLTSPNDPDPNDNEDNRVDREKLIELIRQLVAPETWGGQPWPDPRIDGTNMVVNNTVENVQKVEALLNDLRRTQGLAVNIETRFITVRQDFLQDIGIDFRGIGDSPQGASPPPVAATLDDVGFGTNNAIGGIGTGNDAGFFFQDIASANTVNEDIRSRIENLFDQAVGGQRNGIGLTNTGGASFQLAFVDNPEINAVLRAVKKGDRATLLTAPSVLVSNTQRGFVSYVNQISYISDFTTTAVGATSIADPIIAVVRDGIVLDVRPIVSADRRYITLELRPTLATLTRPIPTVSTSLGTGSAVAIQTPELQLQRMRTTITLPDGGSFMAGGLRRMTDTRLDSGIPILSDLPLVGWLFSRKANIQTKEDVVIVVTARLLELEEEMFERRGYDR
ncbi:MAG: hypothetical protein HUU29_09635 [Planctomycetaceae bacterium]|nr:hypothetical protein [Planctomycetaceae bacterium]